MLTIAAQTPATTISTVTAFIYPHNTPASHLSTMLLLVFFNSLPDLGALMVKAGIGVTISYFLLLPLPAEAG